MIAKGGRENKGLREKGNDKERKKKMIPLYMFGSKEGKGKKKEKKKRKKKMLTFNLFSLQKKINMCFFIIYYF